MSARSTATSHPISTSTLSVGVVVVAVLNLANVTLSTSQEQSLIIVVSAVPALIAAGAAWLRKVRSP